MDVFGLAGPQLISIAAMFGLFAFAVWYGGHASEAKVRRDESPQRRRNERS